MQNNIRTGAPMNNHADETSHHEDEYSGSWSGNEGRPEELSSNTKTGTTKNARTAKNTKASTSSRKSSTGKAGTKK